MESELKSSDDISENFSKALLIDALQEDETFSEKEQENNSCNYQFTSENILSFNKYVEVEEKSFSAYDTDSITEDSDELIEEDYFIKSDQEFKHNSRSNPHLVCVKEQKYPTYRRIMSKVQAERQFPSSYYKLDKTTTDILSGLINVRPIRRFQEVIGKGRNSVVISAGFTNFKHGILFDSFVNAIKIYKLTGDENLNKLICKRAQEEFDNMRSLRRSWLVHNVPFPAYCHKNVIVMGLIGTTDKPAIPLSRIPQKDCQCIYDKMIICLERFYHCSIVHGNMSAENILIWQCTPFFVGWSRSTWKNNPLAPKKLMRDCCFVTKFFKSKNMSVISAEDLFKSITKVKELSPEVLEVLQKRPRKRTPRNPNRTHSAPSRSTSSRFKIS